VIPDDAPVPQDMSLCRRVHPSEIVWNDNDGCLRPGSGVFKDHEMRSTWTTCCETRSERPSPYWTAKPQHSLVSLTVGFVEGEEQTVRRTPKPEDASHGDVCGDKSRGRRKKFARAAQFVVLREDALNPDELVKMRAAIDDS
jgi:hypothetical protein